jgi:hypothetical protein
MKRQLFFAALIGGIVGAVAIIIVLVFINHTAPMETKDLLSFVLSTVSIVIAAVTVLGAVILVTTWNDIDERTGKIVTKYEEQAKQGIDSYRQAKETELDSNAKERQEAIDGTAKRVTTMMDDMVQQYKNVIKRNNWLMGALMVVAAGFLVWIDFRVMRVEKRHGSAKKSNE